MTFAQFIGSGSTGIIGIINVVIVPLIFALAFVSFLWGILTFFFFGGGDAAKREQGRQFIFWGILGMVVLFAVWGLVSIMLSTLGLV